MCHIVAINKNILVAKSKLGELVLDECFRRTQSCCVDDGQYWFTDPKEFSIVESTLAEYGFKWSFTA